MFTLSLLFPSCIQVCVPDPCHYPWGAGAGWGDQLCGSSSRLEPKAQVLVLLRLGFRISAGLDLGSVIFEIDGFCGV